MPYRVNWEDLPEVEVLPNNFRRSASGMKAGVNRLRIEHPCETPLHQHAQEEQLVLMLAGSLEIQIEEESILANAGDVVAVPPGKKHKFTTIEGTAELFEIFAPTRIQNLIGFVGTVFD